VRVSENGALLPETKAVIALIAKHGLVLASGHVSAAEALMMFEEGRREGVRAMVATHGMSTPTMLSVEQAKRANALGVLVEFTGDTMQGPNARARVDRIAADIRSIGVENSIVSSDLGKGGAEMPVEGLATLLEALRQKGFTDRELDQLVKDNPARLLGLK
jgi:microsomal dipeptidase-like Zn-dependent dipeptidase